MRRSGKAAWQGWARRFADATADLYSAAIFLHDARADARGSYGSRCVAASSGSTKWLQRRTTPGIGKWGATASAASPAAKKRIVELEGAEVQTALMNSLTDREQLLAFEGTVSAVENGIARDQITGRPVAYPRLELGEASGAEGHDRYLYAYLRALGNPTRLAARQTSERAPAPP